MNKFGLFLACRFLALFAACACLPAVVNAASTEDFFKAVVMNNASEVRQLLQQGMNPNATEKYYGNTALMVALQEGSMRVFQELVNVPGLDLEAKANNGNNALMIAAYKGNMAAVDILLKKGVAVNRPGWTPLHYAAAGGQNRIVQIFLDRGADINARSPNLTTPLMIAAYEGFDATVKLLIERGADVALKNDAGLHAGDYARRLDRRDIIDYIAVYLRSAELQIAESQSEW